MSSNFNTHRSGALTVLFGCCMAGATWHCCRFDAGSVYTIQPCTSLQCHFIQRHTGTVHACLAVTCHLHFWHNDWDLLCTTTVTRRCNGYRSKSQHRKLTMEKKILPPLLRGLEPGNFRSRVRRSNLWVIPAPSIVNEDFVSCFNIVNQDVVSYFSLTGLYIVIALCQHHMPVILRPPLRRLAVISARWSRHGQLLYHA